MYSTEVLASKNTQNNLREFVFPPLSKFLLKVVNYLRFVLPREKPLKLYQRFTNFALSTIDSGKISSLSSNKDTNWMLHECYI